MTFSSTVPIKTKTLTLQSRLEDAREAAVVARSFCSDSPMPEEDAFMVELAVSEASSNIVRHAYGGKSGQVMKVEFQLYEDRVIVELSDQGQHLTKSLLDSARMPTAECPDTDTPQDHGRGLAIILEVMDHVSSKRKNEWNILRMTKYFRPRTTGDTT